MASNVIKGLTVEIGGDATKLGKALEGVEKQSKALTDELRDVDRLLKFNPGNADLLAQKQEILAKTIATTKSKLDALKDAERQVQEQFERGEVSEEQVRALQREIIATESKLSKYENSARETAEQIDKLGDNSADAEKDVKEVGTKAEDTGKKLDKAGDKAKGFGDKAKKAGEVAKKGFAAVGAAVGAAVAGLAGASVNAAAYADETLTMSTVTGISTEQLQEFGYAAELVDVSTETITKSMAKNIKSMASAEQGSKTYVAAYEKLGVSVMDANGNMRDGQTVYWEAIDALGKMTNETERDAVAMQLFGKSAQELNPLIEAGSARMQELAQEAHDVGAVLSEDALSALGSFDDSIQRLKGSAGAAKNSLGSVLLPELQLITDSGGELLSEFTRTLNASGGGLGGFASTITAMAPQLAATVAGLASQLLNAVSTLAPSLLTAVLGIATQLTTTLMTMLPQLVTTGVQLISALLTGLAQALPQLVAATVAMIPQLVNALVLGIPQLIQGALQFFLAILDAIPQLLPPLIAAIPQIILAIINAVLAAYPQLIQGALQFLLAIVDAIPQLIAALVPQLPTIINTVVTGLTSNIPLLLQAAVQLLHAIIDAIPILIQALVPQLPSIINSITSCLIQNIPLLVSAAVEFFFAILQAIPQLVSALWSQLPTVISTVVEVLSELPGKLVEIGGSLITGLWNGVSDKLTWLKNKLSGFASSVLDSIKSFFGVNSPSKETAWVGDMLDQGLAKGVEDNASDPIRAMRRVSAGVLDAAAGDVGGIGFERSLSATRTAGAAGFAAADNASLLAKLDGIYERLGRLQIVMDSGALVGETIDKIDAGLAGRQLLHARGV